MDPRRYNFRDLNNIRTGIARMEAWHDRRPSPHQIALARKAYVIRRALRRWVRVRRSARLLTRYLPGREIGYTRFYPSRMRW